MKKHTLKCWPDYFEQIRIGNKRFDVRRDDRNFNIGDSVTFEEFRPGVGEYTGRQMHRFITYVLRPTGKADTEGLREGFCVLGISMTATRAA